jgi:hypothetical protein
VVPSGPAGGEDQPGTEELVQLFKYNCFASRDGRLFMMQGREIKPKIATPHRKTGAYGTQISGVRKSQVWVTLVHIMGHCFVEGFDLDRRDTLKPVDASVVIRQITEGGGHGAANLQLGSP